MAGQQQQYYEEPAGQEYYDQEQQPAGSTGEDLTALASVPWVAIALAVHVILLVIAYFIYPPIQQRPEIAVIEAQQPQIAEPPPIEQPPEVEQPFPKDEPVQPDPTEDERITEDATDDVNEDPSDKPFEDLAENPNDDPSDNESPHPNKNSTTSAVGLGGGIGGGGGRGGKGGFAYRRARGGGGKPQDDRSKAALEWLKDHQNREGYWSATTFSDDSAREGAKKTYNVEFTGINDPNGDKGWEATCDIGLTGMSLLAFVGAGYDHKEGEYRQTCRQAVMYLRKVQDNDGCFGAKEDDHFVYNHAICAMAMAEAYGLSGDTVLKPIADKGVEFILKSQNPGLGWRYGVQPGINDSSVTGWMVLALKSCKMAGLEFDTDKCYADAHEWFKVVTLDNVDGYPKTGYDSPGSNNARLRSSTDYDHNPSMDAIYVMSMLFMGKSDINNHTIKSQAKACTEKKYLPQWGMKDAEGKHVPFNIDYYYWYYASLALYQVGGSTWNTWIKPCFDVLMDNQRGWTKHDKDKGLISKKDLDEHGSWDAVDAWSSAGGRVYATAINCLTLEVYYRYERLGGDEKK